MFTEQACDFISVKSNVESVPKALEPLGVRTKGKTEEETALGASEEGGQNLQPRLLKLFTAHGGGPTLAFLSWMLKDLSLALPVCLILPVCFLMTLLFVIM